MVKENSVRHRTLKSGCGKIFRIDGFGVACGERVEGDLFLCRDCKGEADQ